MVHQTDKSLAEFGDKVGEGEKAAITTAQADLKTALEGEDLEEIKTKTQALVQASMKLGEAMYAAAAGRRGQRGRSGEHAADDGVVDAEFEEVERRQEVGLTA